MQKGRKAKLRLNDRRALLQAVSGWEVAEDKAWMVCRAAKLEAQLTKVAAIKRARDEYRTRVKTAEVTYQAAVAATRKKLFPVGAPAPA